MKNVLVGAAMAGLAYAAIISNAWSWLVAVICLTIAFYVGRSARLSTRVQLILVGALGGGLGAEIVSTLYLALGGMAAQGGMYREVLIVSLGSALIVLGAMIVEFLLIKLFSRVYKKD